MPKSAVISENPTEGAVVHSGINGINEEQLKGFVAEIEAEDAKIEAIMEQAKKDCQPFVDHIKAIKKAAAEADIQKKPFAAKLRERKLLRKASSVTDKLSEDDMSKFEEISQKLRDFDMPNVMDLFSWS